MTFSFHFLHVIIAEIWYVGMRLSIGHVQEYITHYCTLAGLNSVPGYLCPAPNTIPALSLNLSSESARELE